MHLLGRSALLGALVGLLSFLLREAAYAQFRIISEDVRVPVSNAHYTIAVRILRPQGDVRFGAIVLNHGGAGTRAEPMRESPEQLTAAAAVFAEDGYVV